MLIKIFSFRRVQVFRLFLVLCVSFCMTACSHLKKPQDRLTEEALETAQDTLKNKSLAEIVERGPRTVPYSALNNNEGAGQTSGVGPAQIGQVPYLSDKSPTALDNVDRSVPPLVNKKILMEVKPAKIPDLLKVVFGKDGGLGLPYVTGPKVAARKDIITLNSSGEMYTQDVLVLIQDALESYGIKMVPKNGSYHIVEDKTLREGIPRFIQSRSRASTPDDLRPIIQFVELEAVDANSMVSFLRQAFGKKSPNLAISGNNRNNYITLTGLPNDVGAALAIIRRLDELKYAGTEVRRYSPKYWKAEDLGVELQKVLTVEGWSVTSNQAETRHVFVMPVPYSNDLFVFAKSAAASKRVDVWLNELDRPIEGGETEQIYIYQVKNVDAVLLAETANAVIDNSNERNRNASRNTPVGTSVEGGPDTGSGSTNLGGFGAFNVDPLGNRIIFTGTVTDYEKLSRLLEQLDTPVPEVLIEVQVAEVSLNEDLSIGVEGFFNDLGSESVDISAGTGGLGLGGAGLTLNLLSGNVDAQLNAFATNSNVKLLSTPVLTARSGGSASIQVGNDIPIITAQRAANNQDGTGQTDILQSISYRSTGVLLTIEPIVFSDNRIDLTVTQEVSSSLDTATGGIASPTISNRNISTQLSLEDGSTAVLGGLMQESYVVDETGVPFLKDIPIIGQAFSVDSSTLDKTELVVLITAYVLRGQADKTQFVDALSRRIDKAIANEERLVTLRPKNF